MKNKLVIVESPAKARTLSKILGSRYVVKASLGHIRDLPKSAFGIDIDDDFKPNYMVLKEKRKTINDLKQSTENATAIYLATDPDREGEAISWHLVEAMKLDDKEKSVHRVTFHEITPEAVKQAFNNPRTIDMDLVNAQQARRLLDRIVGYKLSPLLWKKVLRRGLSAGRVQSVAVRIIVDREREIRNFKQVEYWIIEVELAKDEVPRKSLTFKALLYGLSDGTKLTISNEDEANKLSDDLKKSFYSIRDIQTKHVSRRPLPPFTTSTMQQEAWWRLRYSANRTMAIAQQLYEGVALGEEGSVGLITYMRTDSTYVTASAMLEAREYIQNKFGLDFLPVKLRIFGKKNKWSQEAHEAIRPTKIFREPEKVKPFLKQEQYRLYELIWKRMVASQMSEAIFDAVNVAIDAKYLQSKKNYLLKVATSKLKFSGFMILYTATKDEDAKEELTTTLPELRKGEKLILVEIYPKQKFTEPPSRYNEATLIKALEQKGIGRPSTYAPTISTIQEREYVYKEDGKFKPGEIGEIVNDILVEHFSNIVDLNFTAKIENDLDSIASGKKEWVTVLKDFYKPFNKTLEKAINEVCPDCGKPMVIKSGRFGGFLACSGYPSCKKTLPLIAKTDIESKEVCPDCGKPMIIKSGRFGEFLACSGYPECKKKVPLIAKIERASKEVCPDCGKPMVIKKGRFGEFLACSGYPDCKKTLPLIIKTGVPCPECGDLEKGELIERRSKKKRIFYGCSRYPQCRFAVRQKPFSKPCPECNKLLVYYKKDLVKCTSCNYRGSPDLLEKSVSIE